MGDKMKKIDEQKLRDLLHEFGEIISLRSLLYTYEVSEKFIEDYMEDDGNPYHENDDEDGYYLNICWQMIFIYQRVSEKFIEKHIHKVEWDDIVSHQKLSESFIRKYIHRIIIRSSSTLIRTHDLSEDFIDEYGDKIGWYYISLYQKMSTQFIIDHINKLDVRNLYQNKKLNQKKLQKLNLDVLKILI